MATQVDQAAKLASVRFMQKKKIQIIQLQKEKGLLASGKSASQLRVDENGNKFELIDGGGSFEVQDFGRHPGKYPPFEAIYLWLGYQKYGLTWTNEASRRSLAWAIVKKIKREGTYTYRIKKPTRVLQDAINDNEFIELKDELVSITTAAIRTDIQRIYLNKNLKGL